MKSFYSIYRMGEGWLTDPGGILDLGTDDYREANRLAEAALEARGLRWDGTLCVGLCRILAPMERYHGDTGKTEKLKADLEELRRLRGWKCQAQALLREARP